MQVSTTKGHRMCLVLISTLTLTLSLAYGKPPGCFHEAVIGYKGLYRNTHSRNIMECARGTVFDPMQCTCVHGAWKKKVCTFKAVNGNKKIYTDTKTGKVMACEPGWVYNSLLCKCDRPRFIEKVCKPRFSLDFNKTAENKIKRYNFGGGNTIKVIDGKGKFTDHSALIFWTFKNRPFDENFQIQMSFQDDPTSKARRQVLVTNCNAKDHPSVPSVLIYLDKTKENPARKDLLKVHMRTDTMTEGAEVAVPFISGEINIIVVLKVMNTLKVRIIYENGMEDLSSNQLIGEVITSDNSLLVGSCPGDHNGFVGDLDWFDFFPCWPKKMK